jgi:hypothetical protein
LYEFLTVFNENQLERLIGQDTYNFEFRNAYVNKGCFAPRAPLSFDNIILYLSYDGIYLYDGQRGQEVNKRLSKYLQDNLNKTYIHKSAATNYKGLYFLSYPKGTSTVNSETIVIDLFNRQISVYNFGFSCFSLWDKMGDGEQLFGGSTTEGRVYELFANKDDDGSVIACSDECDFLDFGVPELYKQFLNIYIKVKSTSGTSLKMYYTLLGDNGVATETSKDITLEENTTKWYKINLVGGGQRGRAIKIRPYVSDKYDITFMGYMIVFDMEAKEY